MLGNTPEERRSHLDYDNYNLCSVQKVSLQNVETSCFMYGECTRLVQRADKKGLPPPKSLTIQQLLSALPHPKLFSTASENTFSMYPSI